MKLFALGGKNGKNAEIRKEDFPGSGRSMHGYILTNPSLKME